MRRLDAISRFGVVTAGQLLRLQPDVALTIRMPSGEKQLQANVTTPLHQRGAFYIEPDRSLHQKVDNLTATDEGRIGGNFPLTADALRQHLVELPTVLTRLLGAHTPVDLPTLSDRNSRFVYPDTEGRLHVWLLQQADHVPGARHVVEHVSDPLPKPLLELPADTPVFPELNIVA
ncbi:MAG: hypothetical protein KC474_03400 [Cyanobacteria bacterium HKST-UBA04]|nr:hypothetical protein [Cyanobacteria bacterium HKST-UBA04]MCA9842505.1 hypothetical protein [Cyanobacteria bacterium HKST-UBA03]